MNENLLAQIQAAQESLMPQFKALRMATGALRNANKLAGEDRHDALAMQKALVKLQLANELVENDALSTAVEAFTSETQTALDALAFEFARDLKEVFEERGERVEGRPPTLVVNGLVLQIDIVVRKARWFYGKEALTRPIPLSLSTILKAYDRQQRTVMQRETDVNAFLTELHTAWQQLIEERSRRPTGGRINIIETYSKVILNRQSARFWNAPARRTFKDYERPHFVRDLVYAQDVPTTVVDGSIYHLRLGVATKSQADNPQRSIWLPNGPLDGEYYSDVTFEKVE
jgi:hypothetical protein